MSYNFTTDRIEVRSALDTKKPRYVVNGYALVPDKFDSYGYEWDTRGNVNKAFNSMFTKNCIESIKKQSKYKKLFVDSQHELALSNNIKSMVKDKLSPKEMARMDSFLKGKRLPIAKLTNIEFDEKGIFIETELNPMFREVDEDHQRYFDAVWYSLENKYLNGISINFIPTDVTEDEQGREVINDLDIAGFSYVDRPGVPEQNIAEVAIRSALDFVKDEGEKKMDEEEKKKFEEEKKKFDEDKKKFEEDKVAEDKKKSDEEEEAQKKEKEDEIAKQAADHKKVEDELAEKNEALKKAEEDKKKAEDELNSSKGTVAETKPPAEGAVDGNEPKDDKFYKGKLSEITADHDKTIEILQSGKKPLQDNTFEGFGKLVNLGLQAGNPTADLDTKNAEYIKENRLLDKGGADVMAPRTPQN